MSWIAMVASMPTRRRDSMEEEQVKDFQEIEAHDLEPGALLEQMKAKGYALVRGLLRLDTVGAVLGDVTRVLSAAGWLLPDCDPRERMAVCGAACGDPDPAFKRAYQEVFNLESFHALPHQPALREAMKM